MLKLGLFASHRGSNIEAIVDAWRAKTLQVEPSVIISNNRQSGALQIAQRECIPGYHLSAAQFGGDEEALDKAILSCLEEHSVTTILLLGYLRLLGPLTIARYSGNIFNIHPSLLPKYGGKGMYGIRVHQAVIENRDQETGITIHEVNEQYDDGVILAQTKVRVYPKDTAETLAARVLEREHAFLVETLQMMTINQ